MNNTLKLILGIALAALVIGVSGIPAQAERYSGMMGAGFDNSMHGSMMGNGIMGIQQGMMQSGRGMMSMMNGNPDVADMKEMHKRMLAGNLTQDDLDEMNEHCPMMG